MALVVSGPVHPLCIGCGNNKHTTIYQLTAHYLCPDHSMSTNQYYAHFSCKRRLDAVVNRCLEAGWCMLELEVSEIIIDQSIGHYKRDMAQVHRERARAKIMLAESEVKRMIAEATRP